ncbi:hypothetical protein GCM10027589_51830 [Actinocorallia lasiicapitis]
MFPVISDLFEPSALRQAIESGHVRAQTHPDLPYTIFNYTEKAVYERVWDAVTLTCRGLIADAEGRIIARPYGKFFNYAEHAPGTLDLDAPVVVSDKLDGSLGVLYPVPGGHAVATRGSFTSDQAVHATRVWRERYAPNVKVEDGVTYLFEIIFPANRIVCDYGVLDDLILLGGVDLATGAPVDARELDWPGRIAETFPHATFGEALAAVPRPGAEGLIVRFPDGLMVKLKQDDYLALHRVVTGLNARVVWERLGGGESVREICEGLPDEFHDWVRKVADGLERARAELAAEVAAAHAKIVAGLPDGWGRKDYAAVAGRSPLRGWLFLALDDRDASAKMWQHLKPAGDLRPVNVSEDTA